MLVRVPKKFRSKADYLWGRKGRVVEEQLSPDGNPLFQYRVQWLETGGLRPSEEPYTNSSYFLSARDMKHFYYGNDNCCEPAKWSTSYIPDDFTNIEWYPEYLDEDYEFKSNEVVSIVSKPQKVPESVENDRYEFGGDTITIDEQPNTIVDEQLKTQDPNQMEEPVHYLTPPAIDNVLRCHNTTKIVYVSPKRADKRVREAPEEVQPVPKRRKRNTIPNIDRIPGESLSRYYRRIGVE